MQPPLQAALYSSAAEGMTDRCFAVTNSNRKVTLK